MKNLFVKITALTIAIVGVSFAAEANETAVQPLEAVPPVSAEEEFIAKLSEQEQKAFAQLTPEQRQAVMGVVSASTEELAGNDVSKTPSVAPTR